MANEGKEVKFTAALSPEYELASYANMVYVAAAENDVTLTFFQIVSPVGDVEETAAKPVGRIVVPRKVAAQLRDILSNMGDLP